MELVVRKRAIGKTPQYQRKGKRSKSVHFFGGSSFIATFGVCGLDYRFGWSSVPFAAVIAALVTMLAGYALFVITLTHNRFASRVVEIQNGQKVIDTGAYAVVRHPLYTAAIVMFFASPVVLGSWWAVIPMLIFLVGIILRILNEEKILRDGLDGYANYMKKVRYRLIPFIW